MFSLVRWLDVLDIAIISFILYRFLLLLLDTRAMQLMKGLFILGGIAAVAKVLQLSALSWLLSKLLGVVFIAIPIIFQPELRRLLEELGRGNLWQRRMAEERAEHLADEVTRALLYLQSQKIGALLVFQRGTGLRDIWRSAVRLNAEISQEEVVSIFWPNNPLHDGAAIFDKDRILAAASYLPLTEKSDLSRSFGTRHRAALGVTEISDAISLVVSEERGEISMAINGHISRGMKEPQIRKLLFSYFRGKKEKQSFFERVRLELLQQLSGENEHEDA
ncbi:diadenylate cyclase CdaA [Aminiphilus circumscriptus]|jgi:diadenylate cyclase|uniref:diadenylate cyclase CdaA n=1 Tax=Aminiphilus circumscriptus TaxID=290732 RepID=UPI000492AD24|nr:diadenylate cyclase CdaA [Aminiphilus circumscriptus]